MSGGKQGPHYTSIIIMDVGVDPANNGDNIMEGPLTSSSAVDTNGNDNVSEDNDNNIEDNINEAASEDSGMSSVDNHNMSGRKMSEMSPISAYAQLYIVNIMSP